MSPHEQCRKGVAALVRSLNLADSSGVLPGAQVYEHGVADERNVKYPLVLCTLAGLHEVSEWWTFGEQLWSYPVLVLIGRRGDQADEREMPAYLDWRDRIIKALEDAKSMSVVVGFHNCRAEEQNSLTSMARGRTEPGQITDPAGPAWLKVAGSVVAWIDVVRAA